MKRRVCAPVFPILNLAGALRTMNTQPLAKQTLRHCLFGCRGLRHFIPDNLLPALTDAGIQAYSSVDVEGTLSAILTKNSGYADSTSGEIDAAGPHRYSRNAWSRRGKGKLVVRKLQHVWILLLLLLAGVAAAWSSDVTGKWAGSMRLDAGGEGTASLHLKQNGTEITGTQGPSDEKQFPITKGQIDGDQVTVEAKPGSATLRLTMKLSGDNLTGDVFEDDQKIGTIALQRVVTK